VASQEGEKGIPCILEDGAVVKEGRGKVYRIGNYVVSLRNLLGANILWLLPKGRKGLA